MPESICAVVVSYYPDAQLLTNIEKLAPQVDEIVVVDNGSDADTQALICQIEDMAKVKVMRNLENVGIAAALNVGARYALTQGHAWLATFDQDSTATEGFISALLSAYHACPDRAQVGIVSPRYRDIACVPEFIRSCARHREHEKYSEVKVTMTSGNIVRTSTFMTAGFFDDRMFIDYVDHEFCLRLAKHGLKIIEAWQAVLDHRCGNTTTHHFLGKTIRATNHSVQRRYYISRNRIVVFKRYLSQEPWWVLDDMFNFLVRDPLKVLLFEDKAALKIRAMLRGALDGILDRLGRYRA